jgi:hypothetical protein
MGGVKMTYAAKWKIKGNPERFKLFKLKKTVQSHEKHLRRFAGDKLLYYDVTEL